MRLRRSVVVAMSLLFSVLSALGGQSGQIAEVDKSLIREDVVAATQAAMRRIASDPTQPE
ncbi:MAG: hypothetical protein E2P02_20680 [Acidobacteria bacterium]|nr:MAG: hypothetical protein E2P02_20680 [Acidobacteriota bacterium]